LWNRKKILKTIEVATPKNLTDFKLNFVKIVNFLGVKNRIAVGAAGIIEKNKLKKSPNMPYIKNFVFADEKFKAEKIDNDARCFARAEYSMGNAAGREKENIFFITLGTGVGRAAVKKKKVLNIKKFEYPEKWESEYQKLRDKKNDAKLAEFLGEKITKIVKPYNSQLIIIGGGMLKKKGFFKKLRQKIAIPIKKSKFNKNGIALGAAMLL